MSSAREESGSSTSKRLRSVPAAAWVVAASVVLMVPSLIGGRPFVYWDTPTFYGWGHDIVAALRHPWPPLASFPEHRGLWSADNYPGAWDKITAAQFQLVMTAIGARSSFYALPFYLLGSRLTLWAPAVVQALLTAWLLHVTVRVVLPDARPWAYARLILGLTALTSAPLFVGFLMPDIFAALALLSVPLLLCYHDRLTRPQRVGCGALLAYSVVVHLSIVPTVLAVVVIGAVLMRRLVPVPPFLRRAMPAVAIALLCAAVVAFGFGKVLTTVFGQDVRAPPFLEGRVIADGPGARLLEETCDQRAWAACLWKDRVVHTTDDIIWPDLSWAHLPLMTDPSERRRFLDEQTPFVLAAVLRHPIAQLLASARNAVVQAGRFTVASDIGGSLAGLLRAHSDRTMRVMQIVPHIRWCVKPRAQACDRVVAFRYAQVVEYAVVSASLLLLIGAAVAYAATGGGHGRAGAEQRRMIAFAVTIVAGVAVNAVVCGAISGPWGRYQARVIWLVPMTAALAAELIDQQRRRLGSGWLAPRPGLGLEG